jgi:hypothetical protein
MTTHAIAGIVGVNVLYLLLGFAVLWSLRSFGSWLELFRYSGLSYLLGVAVFGCTWTLLLVLGLPFGLVSIVVSIVMLSLAAIALGYRRGHVVPPLGRLGAVGPASIVAAVGVAAVGVYLEILFRAGRLQGLFAWDAWAFWVPKGKAIYYFGGLDHELFRTLANSRYPPLLPIVDAAAFHFMGAADTTTLHLQFWFFAVGFVAAVAGILWGRVQPWILWPFLLLLVVAPRISANVLTPQADFLLDFWIAVGALLLFLWIRDRSGWLVATTTILFAGAVVTKREGLLLVACVYAAALAATIGTWRRRWPSLFLSGAVVALATVPWRVWNLHNVGSGGGTAEPSGFWDFDSDRAGRALRLSLDVLFETSRWSVIPVLVVCAIVLGLVWGPRSEALFVATLFSLATLAGAWITLVVTEFPVTANEALNPIVRYTAAIVLTGACTTPLLLAEVWRGTAGRSP